MVVVSSLFAAACATGGDDAPAGGADATTVDGRAPDGDAVDAMVDARAIDARPIDAGPPPAGLAAWYRFEEADGALVLDATGHGHHGTIMGSSQRVPGQQGQGLRLFGGGFVQVAAAPGLDFVTAGTMEVWLKVPAATIGDGVFNVLSRGSGNGGNLVSFNSSCGNIQSIFMHSPGVTAPTTSCGVLQPDVWQHVAITNDGVTGRVYHDGVLVTSGAGGNLGPQVEPLIIGRREQGVFVIPDGTVDEIKWWTVARTADQICVDAGLPACATP